VSVRGEHGRDQDWISCRILTIFSDQDWIWVFIFEKNWIRTGPGYLFAFYNESSRRVIHDVTNDGGSVLFACEDSLLYGERIRTSLDTVDNLKVGSLHYCITALCHRNESA